MDAEKIAQLKELASMKESGILTEKEFEEQKGRLLAVPSVPVAPIQPVAAGMPLMQPQMQMPINWS